MNIVGIFGVLGLFFVPAAAALLIVYLVLQSRNRRNRLQAELYAKAIEKGVALPPDLFAGKPNKQKALQTGILCMATGVGIALFFGGMALVGQKDALTGMPIGAIPLAIGLGYMLVYLLERKAASGNE